MRHTESDSSPPLLSSEDQWYQIHNHRIDVCLRRIIIGRSEDQSLRLARDNMNIKSPRSCRRFPKIGEWHLGTFTFPHTRFTIPRQIDACLAEPTHPTKKDRAARKARPFPSAQPLINPHLTPITSTRKKKPFPSTRSPSERALAGSWRPIKDKVCLTAIQRAVDCRYTSNGIPMRLVVRRHHRVSRAHLIGSTNQNAPVVFYARSSGIRHILFAFEASLSIARPR